MLTLKQRELRRVSQPQAKSLLKRRLSGLRQPFCCRCQRTMLAADALPLLVSTLQRRSAAATVCQALLALAVLVRRLRVLVLPRPLVLQLRQMEASSLPLPSACAGGRARSRQQRRLLRQQQRLLRQQQKQRHSRRLSSH